MRFKSTIPLFFLIFCALTSFGQHQDRYWYFGNHAGLNFITDPPTPLADGAMEAFEGCATIADTAGNLLFYTDGAMVWARNHTPMLNGFGLYGDGKATETAIIVPSPGNINEYYIFTVDTNGGPRGLNYSTVDMTLNSGSGDVSTKNISLVTPVAEKLTAVRHGNKKDAWVIVHPWNTGDFNAFLINASGVSTSPVVSTTGSVHGGNFSNSHGYLKASSDGKKIAVAIRGLKIVEVFDFDDLTGIVSNPVQITFSKEVYGLEFSPDNTLLYVAEFSSTSNITQYYLSGTPAAIASSGIVIGTYTGHFLGALQAGPNNKIYGAPYQSTSLPVINHPDSRGLACGFNSTGQSLALLTSSDYGLPNFLKNFYLVADYTYADTCAGSPTQFTLQFANPDSVKWDFGDGASGTANTSILSNPQHTFSNAGPFDVKLIVYQGALSDTVIKTINILSPPNAQLGVDKSGCTGSSFTFYPGAFPAGTTYLWRDGSVLDNYTATSSDTVWVKVTYDGCSGYDTVVVTITPLPSVSFGLDKIICGDDSLLLDATTSGATYQWQDGSTDSVYYVKATGNYGVYVKLNGCIGGDTIFVNVTSTPTVSLGNDTTICKGFQLFYDVNNLDPNTTYLWQDGSTNSFYFASDSGTISVTATAGTCSSSDAVHIDLQVKPVIFLGEDTVLCAGQPIELNAYTYGATYQWQDGSADSVYFPQLDGKYSVTVTNQCGVGADTVLVTLLTCNCTVFLPTVFTPNNDTKNDVFNYKYNCTEFIPELMIFNRIGQLVFKSNNPDLGWDGTYLNKPAEEGVYIYLLKYTGYDDRRHINTTKRGSFALIR